jgi:hypothetical protein
MSRYRIVPADPERNRADILAVLARSLPDATAERFLWNLEPDPPAGGHWWLAREESSGAFVGVAGLFVRRFRVAGHSCLAGVAGDLAVDQAHRAFGPALPLLKAALSAMPELGLEFIYGTPNPLSEALVLKLGYRTVGDLTKSAKVLRAEYRSGTWLPPQALTRASAWVLDAGLALFSRERGRRLPAGWTVETTEACDERFDRFWERAAGQYVVTAERSSAYLNWRLLRSPYRRYRILALCGPGRRVMGYAAYTLQDNICRIAELVFLEAEQSGGEALLGELLLFLRRSGTGSVTFQHLGRPRLNRLLSAFGFMRLTSARTKLVVYVRPDSALADRLGDPSSWLFNDTDGVL